jgi:Co/Zn/Cd efflux system component
VWALSPGKLAMSAHIRAVDSDKTLKKVNRILREKYEIFHSTVQIEKSIDNGEIICCDNDCHHKHH